MATQLKFLRGQSANLAATAVKDGQVLFVVDKGYLYLDKGEERIKMYAQECTDVAALKTKLSALLPDAEGETITSIADQIAAAVATEKARAEAAEKALSDKIGTASVPETSEGAGDGTAATGLIANIEKNAADIKAIQDALGGGGDGEDASLTEKVAANKLAIDTLNGEGEGSVKKTVNDAINKFATDVTDDGVVNSYKELIDYVAEHGEAAAEMAADITSLKNTVGTAAVPGEGDAEGTPATGLVKSVADNADAITAEVTRAKAAEKVNADAIDVLNGADTVEGSVAKAIKDALTGDSGLTWGDFNEVTG